MTRNPLRFIIDVFDLHSELNNRCSGLIGGIIYMILLTAIAIQAPLWYFGG